MKLKQKKNKAKHNKTTTKQITCI